MWNHKIFAQLRKDDNDFVGHVAYSIYKDTKVKWIKHHKEKYDRYPTKEEIDKFFTSPNSTPEAIEKFRSEADRMLNDYFDFTFLEELNEYKEAVKDEAIIQEVHKPFRTAVWENLAAGLIASLLTALLSIVLWLYSEMKTEQRRAELISSMPIAEELKEVLKEHN